MQPQHPTKFAPLSGPLLCALVVLSIMSLTFTPATAREGVAVTWSDGAARTIHAPVASDSIAFTSTRGSHQIRLVDTAHTTLPATVIDFTVDGDQPLRLEVLDLEGQHVRTLAEGLWADGDHRLAWHHQNEDGAPFQNGLYVVRLSTETGVGSEMASLR
ncbi:hypothetical protein DRQ53_03880 [bacterium]|nr:MAG: hypothetical protein DRQ32_12040 [bacterium]RKZ17320.1 MAG: hypothetical protein DRQ53_03880 [bacterium]